MNISFDNLKTTLGDRAADVWAKVCTAGGFGQVPTTHTGGLDISGLPAEIQAEIQALITPGKKETK